MREDNRNPPTLRNICSRPGADDDGRELPSLHGEKPGGVRLVLAEVPGVPVTREEVGRHQGMGTTLTALPVPVGVAEDVVVASPILPQSRVFEHCPSPETLSSRL